MPWLTPARRMALLAGVAALLLPLTVFLGSGSRAEARCMGKFFVSGGEWSWTHLATRCTYGLPDQTGYAYSWASFLLLLVVIAIGWTWVAARTKQ